MIKVQSKLVPTAVVVACFSLLAAGLKLYQFIAQKPGREGYQRIMAADHEHVLAACRQVLKSKANIMPWQTNAPWPQNTDIMTTTHPLWEALVPLEIRRLQPEEIIIASDHVKVRVSSPPRTFVIGFEKGAEEFGTTEIIDGLWYWNGNHQTANQRLEAMR